MKRTKPRRRRNAVKLWESMRYALGALRANKMRSALTMLGIVIGVGAVITLLSLSIGAKDQINRGIEDIGSNIIMIVPGSVELSGSIGTKPSERRGGTMLQANYLRPGLAEEIQKKLPSGFYATCILMDARPVGHKDKRYFTNVLGTGETYPQVRDQKVAAGRFFNHKDRSRDVCVLGSFTARELFGELDPLGREIKVANHKLKVIGVLEEKGKSFLIDNDDLVLIPSDLSARVFGKSESDYILVKAPSPEEVSQAAEISRTVLSKTLEDTDFTIIPQTQMLSFAGGIAHLLTYLVVAIAGISLLVGGIGIMNIMLVSVTERTREIGLRKAVGAKPRNIMAQFLAEALILTITGGALGILLAVVGSKSLGSLLRIPEAITAWSVLLAFLFSFAVGIFFGIYPAFKAARLQPMDALRYE